MNKLVKWLLEAKVRRLLKKIQKHERFILKCMHYRRRAMKWRKEDIKELHQTMKRLQ